MAMRTVQDLVHAAGKVIGRTGNDCEPFVTILNENWFDTPESLEATTTDELCGLGIPLRFAQQIINLAKVPEDEEESPARAGKGKSRIEPIRARGGRGRSPIRPGRGGL